MCKSAVASPLGPVGRPVLARLCLSTGFYTSLPKQESQAVGLALSVVWTGEVQVAVPSQTWCS